MSLALVNGGSATDRFELYPQLLATSVINGQTVAAMLVKDIVDSINFVSWRQFTFEHD